VRDNPEIIDLVTRAARGEKQAWNALVERFSPLIWSICRKYRLSDADAEDVGQTVWLQLLDQLAKIRDPAALPGWLVTVTRRECLRVTGGGRPNRPAAWCTADVEIIADEQAPAADQELLAAERNAALLEAFAALPPSGRQLIALLLQDPPVSYADISARLGIPVGSIGPTRRRCVDKLRHYPAVAALISAQN
jgi:RNA polymerase sigma factor (sigma-70 family)